MCDYALYGDPALAALSVWRVCTPVGLDNVFEAVTPIIIISRVEELNSKHM
jgi:hypothetical protein